MFEFFSETVKRIKWRRINIFFLIKRLEEQHCAEWSRIIARIKEESRKKKRLNRIVVKEKGDVRYKDNYLKKRKMIQNRK